MNSKNLKIKYLKGEIAAGSTDPERLLQNLPFTIPGIYIISQKWEKKNIWRSDYNFFELNENNEAIEFNYSFIPNNCSGKFKLIYLCDEEEPKKYRLVQQDYNI